MTVLPSQGAAHLDAAAELLPARPGCTCQWDEQGNPPASCRCRERAQEWARERVREIVRAATPAGFVAVDAITSPKAVEVALQAHTDGALMPTVLAAVVEAARHA